jgi:DNA-binding transcriptional regulator GbsR (MarR family)
MIIAYMTVKENLHQVPLKIDQLEVITGLSRKTVIKTLKELSDLCLIEINKDL